MDGDERLKEAILGFIGEHEAKHGTAVTVREIADGVHVASLGKVTAILHEMARPENDLLERPEPGKHRGYRLSRRGRDLFERHQCDVKRRIRRFHIGRVRAGAMLHEWQEVLGPRAGNLYFDPDDQDIIEVSLAVLPKNNDDIYALRVAGDSMKDALIDDGDIVLVQKSAGPPREGAMVVARDRLEGETVTLKHYHDKGSTVELHPANRAYSPISIAKQHLEILGTVLMVLRWPRQNAAPAAL